MADGSKIEWTDATWNIITGCSLESPGCTNCYAMKLAGGRLKNHPSRVGLTIDTKVGPVWNGKVRFNEYWLDQPRQWTKPRMIFVCAHGDLFHPDVDTVWLDKIFGEMERCHLHTFQVLTKRSERMRDYFSRRYIDGDAPRNIWAGVSIENQEWADNRVPDLLQTPASIRWLSCEPLLGPVDLGAIRVGAHVEIDALKGREWRGPLDFAWPKIDWVVAGGESGPGARPMHPDWARSLRDQCAAAGVPFCFKQWGEWAPGECAGGPVTRTQKGATWFADEWSIEEITPRVAEELHYDDAPDVWRIGKKRAGRLLDGVEHNGFPT